MKKKDWIIGMSAVTGMILGKSLMPMIGIYVARASINQVSQEQVQQYINNSKDINLSFSKYKYSEEQYSVFMYSPPLSASYRFRSVYTFYDNSYKKYFAVIMFYYRDVLLDDSSLLIGKNRIMVCKVNNKELTDGSFGTEKNPIPIFKCKINNIDTTVRLSFDTAINFSKDYQKYFERGNTHYETSVFYYLIHFPNYK